jgi:crotonobetainyl-CoA:carnitine CoA-transferase CaiB-like acyl-CoA transferase
MTVSSSAPLAGVVMLDLTHMLSGPYGTMLLTDLGATTIKVEPPGRGEGTRELLANSADFSREGMGAYFLTLNRGKQSVALDLKSPEGLEVFYDLVRAADVVFDNFSAGVTTKLKIDHATLAAINPRIITCTVSGFGETGPDNQRPAFDQVVQAMGGGMSITGEPDMVPQRAGIPIGDLGGGMFGAMGVLAALVARSQTGVGQHVDISMLDVQVSLLNYMATMYLMSGEVPQRIGNSHFVHVPYNTYPTSDGHVVIACIGDAFFEKFAQMMPLPLLLREEYRRQPARLRDKAQIDAAIAAETCKQPSAFWLERLREARIPCAPVNNFAQALADTQVLARDMVITVPLPGGGTVQMPGNPIKLSAMGTASYSAPPRLGQHTKAVLSSRLHYSAAHIDVLLARSAVAQA